MSEPIYESIHIKNFGPLKDLKWDHLGGINLIVGENGSGKTFLLKALYATIKAVETHERGNNIKKPFPAHLGERLHWTFQAKTIGDLVTKQPADKKKPADFKATISKKKIHYSFGEKATKEVTLVENKVERKNIDSIFLPPKEVLSTQKIILETRDKDQIFGFDDTYYDLAVALRSGTQKGNFHNEVTMFRQQLEKMLGGKIKATKEGEWIYTKGKYKFPMSVTAEGIKKLGILDTLLGSKYLVPGSVIFIDEPETALHPHYISTFLEGLALLAKAGFQIFMASHSYFVIKKLHIIALREQMDIPVLLYEKNAEGSQWHSENLKEDMPDNSIIEESITLYKDEMRL
ncbi:MAG: AAA family ATPase [Vampirovibrionales bacterium]